MSMDPIKIAGVIASLWLLSGCSTTDDAKITAPRGRFRAAVVPGPRGGRGVEDEFLLLNSVAPSFGGLYVDSAQDVVAYTTDVDASPQVVQALGEFLNANPARFAKADGSTPRIHIRVGSYSFAELVTSKDLMRSGSNQIPGAYLLDADEMLNRLRIGLQDSSSIPKARTVAASIGIPDEALSFDVKPAALRLLQTTLSRRRPTGAGIMIELTANDTTSACTLGFNVTTSDSTHYFLTAGHCTANFAGVTGRQAFQASAVADSIGYEYWNPAWSTTGCGHSSIRCRSTDVALFRYYSGISETKEVAQTSTVGTGNSSGNQTISTWTPISGNGGAVVNQTIYKTGRRTGTTSGPLTATCVSMGPFEGTDEVTCANSASMQAGPSDSGSPVYRPSVLVPSTRSAEGILFGADFANPSQTVIYYSPLTVISSAFGSILYAF